MAQCALTVTLVAHWDHREDKDYFSQPGDLFRLMTTEKQALLFGNTARNLNGVPQEIQLRHLKHCYKADEYKCSSAFFVSCLLS